MKRRARVFASAWISLALASGTALGNDQAATLPTAGATEAGGAAYARSLALYEQGDLKQALSSMQESYRLSGRAELLYNLARLESELGECALSLAHYREYLERVPDGRYRQAAEQATSELGERCPAQKEAPTAAIAALAAQAPAESPPVALEAPKQPDHPASPPWSARRWVGWSAIATGALAGAGAVYFTVAALDARSQFKESVDRQYEGGPRAVFGLQDEQHRHQNLATALGITSGALLAGGAVLLIFFPDEPAARAASGIYVQPGLVGAQFSQSF